jgi:hypothetical protein
VLADAKADELVHGWRDHLDEDNKTGSDDGLVRAIRLG